MTRRKILRRAINYLLFHIYSVNSLMFLLTMTYDQDYKVGKFPKDSLFFIVPIIMLNWRFYYRFLYDVLKKNMYEATIIELDVSASKPDVREILGRVLEGTTVGRNKRTYFLKPRRKTDYVFKIRGFIPGCQFQSIIKIKYLKYSKIIVEAKGILENTGMLFEYHKKEKDYLLSSSRISAMNITMEEVKEKTKQGNIEHIKDSFWERMRKVIGATVYSILVSALLFVGYIRLFEILE